MARHKESEVRWLLAVGKHAHALRQRLALTQPQYCVDGQTAHLQAAARVELDAAVDFMIRNAALVTPDVLDAIAHPPLSPVTSAVPERVRSAAARIASSCRRARVDLRAPREAQFPMAAADWRAATALAERLLTRAPHLL